MKRRMYILLVGTLLESDNANYKSIQKRQFTGGAHSGREIFRRDDELILRKKPATLAKAFHLLAQLPDDFMIDRSDEPAQERSDL
jgi:hypothetical protein